MADKDGPHGFNPGWTIAPAATLREWMSENGLSVSVLATASRTYWAEDKEELARLIQEVLDRKPLTARHAQVLARGTGISTYFWLNYEHNYRAGLAVGLTDVTSEDW